jgi:hypothetical protein
MRRMGVFLTVCFALQRRANGFGRSQQGGINHVGRRSWTAVARVDQLHRSTRRRQADHGQLEQACSLMHLGLFQPHPIAFQRAKQLFDTPYKRPLII